MRLSPAKTFVLFFLGLGFIGTLLLTLPFSTQSGVEISVLSNLFTAISAICVTGLSVVSIGEHYSLFGQIVILILIESGGLGYMFISTVTAVLIGKMTLKDKRIMQDIFGMTSFKNIRPMLIKAIVFVLAIEIVGALSLTLCFLRDYSLLKALYLGTFHSITAFCNAGFSTFSDSLIGSAHNYPLLLILSMLITLGGLGFFVLVDVYDTYRQKQIHFLLHTKVVLAVTVIIFVPFVLFILLYEKESLAIAIFQASSIRTAGFIAVPVEMTTELSKFVYMFFMAIGAAPASTAGGIKVTTVAVIFVFVRSFIRSKDDVTIFRRRLSDEVVHKASLIFILTVSAIAVFSAALIALEPYFRSTDLVFEIISAFSNTGVSMNVTPKLGSAGKILDIGAMFIGRIGIITLLISAAGSKSHESNIKYPRANIFVG
ncbi:MAG: hypothetical protein LBB93_00495 [Elusimicrobiota bacterium]|jgi:trk system potassium uptake protein TrkH|nr:hypothetical protein [Elusimicrobiota bacterium]